MKALEFERLLIEQGFVLTRNASHRIWSNGNQSVAVPHKKEINRMMAKRLLKEISYPKSVPEINYFFKAIA